MSSQASGAEIAETDRCLRNFRQADYLHLNLNPRQTCLELTTSKVPNGHDLDLHIMSRIMIASITTPAARAPRAATMMKDIDTSDDDRARLHQSL